VCALPAGDLGSQGDYKSAIGIVGLAWLKIILSESLAARKYYEYRRVKNALSRHGWDKRIIEPKSYSWCQRHAAKAAAIDTGFKEEIDQYYKERGYKWYSFIPDYARAIKNSVSISPLIIRRYFPELPSQSNACVLLSQKPPFLRHTSRSHPGHDIIPCFAVSQ
jgi:hypothetical protein